MIEIRAALVLAFLLVAWPATAQEVMGEQIPEEQRQALIKRNTVKAGPPRGVLKGAKAEVRVDPIHGRRSAPKVLGHAEGPFRLDAFRYAARGQLSSVFFVREGCVAHHVAIKAEDGPGPDLGTITLRKLPGGKGAVSGALANLYHPDGYWGIRSYAQGAVVFTPKGGGAPVRVETSAQGAFEAVLPPGRYDVRVQTSRVVELERREMLTLLVGALRDAPAAERAESVNALRGMTGANPGDDHAAWAAWLAKAKQQGSYTLPGEESEHGSLEVRAGQGTAVILVVSEVC